MKWHPDRNPGREAEVSPRFQLIQSAHEILADESQKRQYDEARGATRGRFPTASGVRGNPWADAGKEFAPPPRRQQQQPAPPPRPPPSGASRYASFTNGMPKTSRPSQEDDAQWRKKTATAFESMRKPRSKQPPPTPGRAPTSASRNSGPSSTSNANPPPPPPRTASQAQKAQASFGNSNRRSGFYPSAPDLGDEPPVTSKNYSTTRTHPQFYEPTESSGPDVTENTPETPIPDPLAQFRAKVGEGRSSTPYATPGGEKTSLFAEQPGLGRSTSTRTPLRREGVPSTSPQQRRRSSTPPRSSGKNSATEQGPDQRDFASGSHSRASERYTPRPESATHDRPFFSEFPSPKSTSGFRESMPLLTLTND